MSILAEPRRRQRISVDPQNLQWKNEEDSFSKKLMKKMGWSSGDGLGKNRQGNSDHVKLKANYSGKGLGADKIASYDSTWIGHHDDFADLLSALNKNKESIAKNEDASTDKNLEKMSIELKSKSIRRRIHYQKFTRAKDCANYTDNDKSSILGLGLKRTKDDEEEITEVDFTSDTKHTVSTQSMTDYFATKMAAFKASRKVKTETDGENFEIKSEEFEVEEEFSIKQEVDDEVKQEEEEEPENEEERERRRKERKAAKKLAKLARRQAEEMEARKIKEEPIDEEEEVIETPKKQKKRALEIEEEQPERKSKKNKKSKKSVDE